MRDMKSNAKFKTWSEVVRAARAARRRDGWGLFYEAPLSPRPMPVRVLGVTQLGVVRVRPDDPDADEFEADARHLERFSQASGLRRWLAKVESQRSRCLYPGGRR